MAPRVGHFDRLNVCTYPNNSSLTSRFKNTDPSTSSVVTLVEGWHPFVNIFRNREVEINCDINLEINKF